MSLDDNGWGAIDSPDITPLRRDLPAREARTWADAEAALRQAAVEAGTAANAYADLGAWWEPGSGVETRRRAAESGRRRQEARDRQQALMLALAVLRGARGG